LAWFLLGAESFFSGMKIAISFLAWYLLFLFLSFFCLFFFLLGAKWKSGAKKTGGFVAGEIEKCSGKDRAFFVVGDLYRKVMQKKRGVL